MEHHGNPKPVDLAADVLFLPRVVVKGSKSQSNQSNSEAGSSSFVGFVTMSDSFNIKIEMIVFNY